MSANNWAVGFSRWPSLHVLYPPLLRDTSVSQGQGLRYLRIHLVLNEEPYRLRIVCAVGAKGGKCQMITGITHFTSQRAAAAILEGWRKDLIAGDKLGDGSKGPPEIKIRLYSRSGTNDPHEQVMAEYGTDLTKQKHSGKATPKFRSTIPDDVFMWCGSKPQKGEKGEETNRLEMWRAYGDDGRGVALTTWWNDEQLKMEGLKIISIEYVPDLESIKSEMKELLDRQKDSRKSRSERDETRIRRLELGARHKHHDYESEQEVRLVCFLGDESGAVRKTGPKEIHFEAPNGRLRTYIERPIRLGTTLTGLDITLGPRMLPGDARHWERLSQWMLAQMGLSGGDVRQSQLEYIG